MDGQEKTAAQDLSQGLLRTDTAAQAVAEGSAQTAGEMADNPYAVFENGNSKPAGQDRAPADKASGNGDAKDAGSAEPVQGQSAGELDKSQEQAGKDGGKDKGEAGKGLTGAFDAKAWDQYVDSLDEGAGLNKAILREFGALAGEGGLNADGAKKLLDWTLATAQREQKQRLERGRGELQKEWGQAYQNNIDRAVGIVAMLDRELGDNRFRKAIENSGACRDPDFVRGMHILAAKLAEDSIGLNSAAEAEHEETALEALQKYFK